MAAKRARRSAPSSELGDGDFAVSYNRNGRPVRNKTRQSHADSPFMDSAVAVSDPEDGDDSNGETISVSHRRKRKRSPSPPLSPSNSFDDALPEEVLPQSPKSEAVVSAIQVTVKDVVINVPANHQGPILLQLDIPSHSSNHISGQGGASRPLKTPSTANRRSKRTNRGKHRATDTESGTISNGQSRAGFLDLPAELRNDIYRQVFVADGSLNFDTARNFSRSAAFLRTCRQVYEEGKSILYSENNFLFVRMTKRSGSFWEGEWNEVGFKAVRRFLKMIGPTNTGLLRHAALLLEDATPCLNPNLVTADDRRFVYDNVLISCLRHLADHAKLQLLELHFRGASCYHH